MSVEKSVVRKTIPLCGIVLILGNLGCNYNRRQPSFVGVQTTITATPDEREKLIALVQDFLKNVPKNERTTFDRFFADDVIYTRGTGQVVTKKDILAETGQATVPRANAAFTGEDFTVHQTGTVAIVNFRLVMHASEKDEPVTRSFRNTGTFMKRNGQWQAIAWQATPIQTEAAQLRSVEAPKLK